MKKKLTKEQYLDKNGKIKSFWCREKFLVKHGLLDALMQQTAFLDDSFNIRERFLCLMHGITERPKCECCHVSVRLNADSGAPGVFRRFCSQKCAASSRDWMSVERDETAAAAKRAATMMEKYGYSYNSQRPENKQANAERSRRRVSELAFTQLNNREWLDKEYNGKKRTAVDIGAELGCDYATVITYIREYGWDVRQRSCYSLYEIEIQQWLEEHGIEYVANTKKIIAPDELDIYIPRYNLAIEFNGIYWHADDNKTRHLKKTEACVAKGIELLHIFENEWLEKKDIWKSMILSRCQQNVKIPARKTIIKDVSSAVARLFLADNHLQGPANGRHIGLFYDEQLVQLITVGSNRFRAGYELIRNCTLKNHTVQGGFSKLLKHIPEMRPIISYCNRRYSTGRSYEKVGFTFLHSSKPAYFWVDTRKMKLLNRMATQKHKLEKLLPDFNPTLSETENMFAAKYRRIWDCGNHVYVKDR